MKFAEKMRHLTAETLANSALFLEKAVAGEVEEDEEDFMYGAVFERSEITIGTLSPPIFLIPFDSPHSNIEK